MTRSVLAVVCVAVLTVTAGCGGTLGGTGTPSREPYDVAPTPTVTGTPTETPARPSASASPAFRNAIEDHTAALRSVGNFTVVRARQSGRNRNERITVPLAKKTKVDLDAGRYAWGVERSDENDGFTVRAYQNDSGVYRRSGDEDAAFRNATGAADLTPRDVAMWTVRRAVNRSVQFPFERNGTATFDGEEMRRFTADDPGPFRGAVTQVENVTQFRATALVDDRGIVRKFTYTLRGELYNNQSYIESETVTITGLGETDVRSLEAIAETGNEGASPRFRAAVGGHTEALWSTESFTIQQTEASGVVRNGTAPDPVTDGVVKADPDAGRYALGKSDGGFEGRVYQNTTGVYRRVRNGDGGTFRNVTDGPGANALTPEEYARVMARYVQNRSVQFPLQRNGTATFDGEEMRRFTTDDPGSFRGRTIQINNVTQFRTTVLIDRRGIVRKFTYTLRGELYTGEIYVESGTVTITDVGSTTVPWPLTGANATATP